MQVLITGGTGFIGSRLAMRCLDRGDMVTVVGQENTLAEREHRQALAERGARIVLKSVTDISAHDEAFHEVDIVFHLAAVQHEMNVPDQAFWDVNVGGTKNVLEASIEADIKRVVHGSTIGVYGAPTAVVDEDSPCKPDNIYGLTKLEGERLALTYHEQVEVVVIRIPEVYGPGDRRLIKLFRPISRNVFFVIGGGNNLHHLIFIDDLIDGLLQAAVHPATPSKTFVLGGPEPITTNEMGAIIAEQLDTRPPRFRAPMLPFLAIAFILEKTLRPLGVQPPLHRRRLDFFRKTFALSSKRAMQTFGFEPKISFAEGALRTATYYKDRGDL